MAKEENSTHLHTTFMPRSILRTLLIPASFLTILKGRHQLGAPFKNKLCKFIYPLAPESSLLLGKFLCAGGMGSPSAFPWFMDFLWLLLFWAGSGVTSFSSCGSWAPGVWAPARFHGTGLIAPQHVGFPGSGWTHASPLLNGLLYHWAWEKTLELFIQEESDPRWVHDFLNCPGRTEILTHSLVKSPNSSVLP